jgi:hypothetical protein
MAMGIKMASLSADAPNDLFKIPESREALGGVAKRLT